MEKLVEHPPSPKQVDANRANAQKSTGPVTEAGKRNVAVAHITYGLYADTLGPFVPELGESLENYAALLEGHMDFWRPEGTQQAVLVKQLTDKSCLHQRALAALADIAKKQLLEVEKQLRQTALKQSREVLDENDPEIQQWGVRRLDDRPAKFEYWSQLFRDMIFLAEHGD